MKITRILGWDIHFYQGTPKTFTLKYRNSEFIDTAKLKLKNKYIYLLMEKWLNSSKHDNLDSKNAKH